MPRNPEHAPIYRTFQEFMERCLIEDRSLFWPDEKVWTLERVLDMKQRLIENPVWGKELSFNDKLLEQLKGADRELWQMLADAYCIYYLPPIDKSVKPETKKKNITWVTQQSGRPLPDASGAWDALNGGFASTGTRYNFRYLQIWFLILLAQVVKQAPDRRARLNSPEAFSKTVEEVLAISPSADRAPDMGRAVLYMALPEHFDTWLSGAKQSANGGKGDGGGDSKVEEKKDLPDVAAVLKTLKQTRNVILYGPPGTGKTHIARKAAEIWTRPKAAEIRSQAATSAEVIDGLAMHDVLALILFEDGKERPLSVSAMLDHPLVRARFEQFPNKYPREALWSPLQGHTVSTSLTVKKSRRWGQALFDKLPDSTWQLTDEGRAYVKSELAAKLALWRGGESAPAQAADFVSWVTFHQNYAYEDFIEGLRPKVGTEGGPLSYQIVAGAFRLICAQAESDHSNRYVLVIDEINRGNIAKILGELLTLLEDDKRAGMENALKVKLPYSQQEFSVPSNLYIIGTMNTTDRSIALLDVALRRRFAFVELMPRPELLTAEVISNGATVALGPLLEALNRAIRADLDRDHQLGHSYFLRVQNTPESERPAALEFVWNHQVLPLLREYYHSQPDRLAVLIRPFLGEEGEGTGAAYDADLVAGLAQIAAGS